jgi:hypothetical protein
MVRPSASAHVSSSPHEYAASSPHRASLIVGEGPNLGGEGELPAARKGHFKGKEAAAAANRSGIIGY